MRELAPLDVLRLYPSHGNTLWGLAKSRAHVHPTRTFLYFDGRELGWRDFCRRVERATWLLQGVGVARGDRVGIMAPNSADYVVVMFAVAAAGAITLPINPALTVPEATYIIGHAKPVLIFCTAETKVVARAAAGQAAVAPAMITMGREFGDRLASVDDGARPGKMSNPRAGADTPPTAGERGSAADDTALILYTSGTTGLPKGVMHSQASMIMTGELFVERMGLQPTDRLLCVLPFYHINALLYSLMGAMAAGASLVLTPRFSASGFWKLAAASGATEANIIATVGRILCKRPRSEFVPSHRITKVYGAPIPADVYKTFREDFHIATLVEGYGLSEAPGLSSNPFRGPQKIGSIGVPTRHPDPARPYAEMKIVDEAGRAAPAGTVGELYVATPAMMQGYYLDPDATAASFQGKWFRTGDIAVRERDGFYRFVARKKDIIRRRGENISGAEIDDVISQHPEVQVAASVAVASDMGEDEILVAVTPRPGSLLTERSLHDWCVDKLNSIKVPRYIVFVDSLPYTPSHRVAKYRLRADESLRKRAVKFS